MPGTAWFRVAVRSRAKRHKGLRVQGTPPNPKRSFSSHTRTHTHTFCGKSRVQVNGESESRKLDLILHPRKEAVLRWFQNYAVLEIESLDTYVRFGEGRGGGRWRRGMPKCLKPSW